MTGFLQSGIAALRRNPLVFAAVAAIGGICLVDRGGLVSPSFLVGAVGFAALVWWTWRGEARRSVAAALLAFLLFGALHRNSIMRVHSFPFAAELAEGNGVEISGRGWIADRTRPASRSFGTVVELEEVEVAGRTIPVSHRVPARVARVPSDEPVRYGDPVSFSGVLRPLESSSAPGGFDEAAFYYREFGSLARLEVREGDRFVAGAETGYAVEGLHLVRLAHAMRDRLESALREGVSPDDEPYARLVAAMSLGARENSPEDLEEAFRLSGTMHVFAVSGLHVGVVAGLVFLGLRLCGVPLRIAALVAIPAILFYAVMTGLRPSALRAATMAAVIFAGIALSEKPRLLNSLALAALVLLALDTQQLFLPGFQLSFAVMVALALFAGPLGNSLARPWLCDPFLPPSLRTSWQRAKDKLVAGTTALLAVSGMAWLGSLGLLTWHFQSVAPIGVVANLLLVPLAGVIVSVAAVASLFHLIGASWLGIAANKLLIGLAVMLSGSAEFFADLPGAHFHTGSPGVRAEEHELATIDVMGVDGEGAALLSFARSSSSGRSSWMIDAGGSNTFAGHLLPVLRSRGTNRIDGLFLTHGDAGHIGAVPDLMARSAPEVIFESILENRSPAYPEIVALAEERRIPLVALASGQRIRLLPGEGDAGPAISVLAPRRRATGRVADDRSLVLKLSVGGAKILFTSDAGFETEQDLLSSGLDLRADVWVRGQHSDAPSGLPRFLDAVAPAAVVTTGSDFPPAESLSEDFMELLNDRNIRLLRLDEDGVVTLGIGTDGTVVRSHRRGIVFAIPRDWRQGR